MRRSLLVAEMPHDDQHLAHNAEAPYMMPRLCDHCAKGFIEAELIPFPKTSSYLRDAPELVCQPCRQRIELRSMRSEEHRDISEKCLMHHDLQETLSCDVGNCTACGVSFLCGARMFECNTCTNIWTYCVDCKQTWDLRPSEEQRKQNAKSRARGHAVVYQSTPAKHPSERCVLAVAKAPEEEANPKKNKRDEEKEKDNVVTGASPSIGEKLATDFVGFTDYSRRRRWTRSRRT